MWDVINLLRATWILILKNNLLTMTNIIYISMCSLDWWNFKDCIEYAVQHTHQLSEIAFDLELGEVEVGVALVWSGAESLRY